jgi:Tfp pilus assembly protein PilN
MRPINLLPPESFEKAKTRRRWVLLGLLGLAYVALLAVVMLWWGGRASDAEDEVASQLEVNTRLRNEVATLAEAEQIQTRYDDNVALVGTVLAQDVSWGRILNDLARMLPDQVWIDSFVGATSSELDSVGSISVAGFGFSYPDVAALLRNFDSDRFPSVGGTWVTSISQVEIGTAQIVNFQSATSLTVLAVSDRALERIPGVGR